MGILFFRTRTDVYIEKEQLEKIFNSQILINTDILKYKIWAPSFHITRPYIINDWCWYGYLDDLKQCVHYNENLAQFLDSPNRIYFIKLFINNDEELKNIINYSLDPKKACYYIKNDKIYQKIIKKWYKICYDNFIFGESNKVGMHWKWSNKFNKQPPGININYFDNHFNGENLFTMCDNIKWLTKLYNNKFDNEKLSKIFLLN